MEKLVRLRITILGLLFAAALLLLVGRLWYIQIAQGEAYAKRASSQSLRRIRLAAPRGNIYDRKLRLLATSSPSYSLAVVPAEVRDPAELVVQLSRLVELDTAKLAALLKEYRRSYTQLIIKSDLDFKTLAAIEEHSAFLPGVAIQEDFKRLYPEGTTAAHLLGQVGEISADELEKRKEQGYSPGDLIGKAGLERQYEQYLRGTPGERWVEMDARGNVTASLGEAKPQPGADLILAVDLDAQKTLEAGLGSRRGAGVVMNPVTGEIIAMASRPTFSPQDFVGGISTAKWKEYTGSKATPLQDRARAGRYPPGSVIKPAMALAGLEAGLIPTSRTATCVGYITLGNRKFGCWKHSGHGTVGLTQALAQSCNVFFYRLGQDLGPERMEAYLRKIQYDQKTGIDLPGEIKGTIPNVAEFGRRWYGGDTLNMAIGQGYIAVTPLEVCRFYAALANGGTLPVPHVVNFIRRPGQQAEQLAFPEGVAINFPEEDLRRVRQGVWECVQGSSGTGRGVKLPGLEFAGKTGTAQDPPGIPHAWFCSWAPFDKPQYVTTVLIERGDSGSKAAVPITKAVYKVLFDKQGKTGNPKPAPLPTPKPAATNATGAATAP